MSSEGLAVFFFLLNRKLGKLNASSDDPAFQRLLLKELLADADETELPIREDLILHHTPRTLYPITIG